VPLVRGHREQSRSASRSRPSGPPATAAKRPPSRSARSHTYRRYLFPGPGRAQAPRQPANGKIAGPLNPRMAKEDRRCCPSNSLPIEKASGGTGVSDKSNRRRPGFRQVFLFCGGVEKCEPKWAHGSCTAHNPPEAVSPRKRRLSPATLQKRPGPRCLFWNGSSPNRQALGSMPNTTPLVSATPASRATWRAGPAKSMVRSV